jgi:hypothetical protein
LKDTWLKDTWLKDTWLKDTCLKDTWLKDTWLKDTWLKDIWVKDTWLKDTWLKDTWPKYNWLKDTWLTELYALSFGRQSTGQIADMSISIKCRAKRSVGQNVFGEKTRNHRNRKTNRQLTIQSKKEGKVYFLFHR